MRRALLTFFCALALGAGATLAATAGAGAADDERYTVVLDNAFGLTEGSDLRSAGVVIGKIEKLDVQRSTARALATIVITRPSFAGLRSDVFCEVRPQSLIGEYYLDCDPGRKQGTSAPRTIPVQQTGGTIPPDLVLDILRRPARERFGLILTELGIGLTARGEDLQTTLRRAVPALRETDKVLSILDANRRTLNQLTRDADTVLAGLADNRRDVGRFIREAADTTEASASRSDELRQSVDKLPRFERELRRAAPDLTELLKRLGPFAESARPAVRGLGEASETGITAVKEARSTVKELRALGTAATEPMRNLRFVLEDINDRDRAVEPNRLSPGGKGFTGLEALLQYFFVQSQAINIYDSKGFILKLNLLINECTQFTNAQTAVEEPERTKRCNSWLGPNQLGVTTGAVSRTTTAKPRARPEQAPDTPADTPATAPPAQQAPAAPPPPPPPPPSLLPSPKELLDKLLPDLPDPPSLLPRKSTRASAEGERTLLDYLLGP